MNDKIMRRCAYCGLDRKLTREHIFPDSIIKANKSNDLKIKFWLSKIEKEIGSDPVIKDVCEICNSGVLSNLDSEGVRFFKDFCLDEVDYNQDSHEIEFDYHLLKRWVMKVGYNSARASDKFGVNAYNHMLPYILGKDLKRGRSASLFCALNYPQEVPEDDQTDWFGQYEPNYVWYPIVNRTSNMQIKFPGVGAKWLKVLTLRGVSLIHTFFDPTTSSTQNEQRDFERVFLSELPFTRRLNPKSSKEDIPTRGLGAWDVFKDSRSKLVFEK